MKIDLGCGKMKKDGYIGIDRVQTGAVDLVHDLATGIPLADDTVSAVYSNHCLEHLPDTVFIMQEIYRVCQHGAVVELRVPYAKSDGAFKDPTHKTFYTEKTFEYFAGDNDRFDYALGVRFTITRVSYIYSGPFRVMARFVPGVVLFPLRRLLWNVVHTVIVEMEVVKC